jgi:Zn-dependent protease
MLVSLAGPLSNFLSAWFVATLIRFIPFEFINQGAVTSIISSFILINLALAVFNLIPIPPLDGSHILEPLIPYEWRRALEQYGFFILIFILIFPPTSYALMYIIDLLFRLIARTG